MTKPVKPTSYNHLVMYAQIRAESAFNPEAVSHAGAKGLMQIMQPTWKEWAKLLGFTDINDPLQNMAVGLLEMNRQVKNFKKLDLALTAYNWGSGNLKKLIIDAKSDDLEVLKKHIPTSGFAKPMPKEAREYAQKVFNYFLDPLTFEMADDYLKLAA